MFIDAVCDGCIAHLPMCRLALEGEGAATAALMFTFGHLVHNLPAALRHHSEIPENRKHLAAAHRSLTRFLWHLVYLIPFCAVFQCVWKLPPSAHLEAKNIRDWSWKAKHPLVAGECRVLKDIAKKAYLGMQMRNLFVVKYSFLALWLQ